MNQTGVPLGTGVRPRMTFERVLVEILDVNDTPPFDFNATELVVLESAEIGTVVGQFIPDSNISSDVIFELNDQIHSLKYENELLTRVDLYYDNLEYYNLISKLGRMKIMKPSTTLMFQLLMLIMHRLKSLPKMIFE